jgi:hypothetical protein
MQDPLVTRHRVTPFKRFAESARTIHGAGPAC